MPRTTDSLALVRRAFSLVNDAQSLSELMDALEGLAVDAAKRLGLESRGGVYVAVSGSLPAPTGEEELGTGKEGADVRKTTFPSPSSERAVGAPRPSTPE